MMVRKRKLSLVLGAVFLLQVPVAQAGVSWGTCRQVVLGQMETVIQRLVDAGRRVVVVESTRPDVKTPARSTSHNVSAKPSRR